MQSENSGEEVKLLEHVELVRSGVKKFTGLKRYVATGSLKTEKIVDCIKVDYQSRPSRANMEVKENDILFAKMKDTEKVFLISKEDAENLYSTGFAVLRVKNCKRVLPKYAFFWLRSHYFQDRKNKECTGATQKAINESKLKKFWIPIPHIEQQRKIAATLEKADHLKQWRNESYELADDYLNSVFLKMFGDPINDSKNWGKRRLKEFGKIVTGNTPSRKRPLYYGDHIEWIKSDNINTPDIFLTRSQEMLSKEGAEVGRTVPKRSVLVTCIAGSLSCIGNVAISDRDVAFNQQINAIVPNESVDEFFLYFLMLNSKKYIQNHSTKAMKGMISKSVFESLPFIFPPSELQRKFGSLCKDSLELKKYQKQSKQKISELCDVLLQKAFGGKLKC